MISLTSYTAATTTTTNLCPQPQQQCFLSPPRHHLSFTPLSLNRKPLCVRCSSSSPTNGNHHNSADIFSGGLFNGPFSCPDKNVTINDDMIKTKENNNNNKTKLKIAIVGFGNFGQFLAKTMVKQGHTVLAYSRSNYSRAANEIGAHFFNDADDLCEEHPEVILLCTSILSTEKVLKSLPLSRLRRSTLIADVLSVKEFPRTLFLQTLPPDFDILCTHPMFGPDSGKVSWAGLPFVFDKVRVGPGPTRSARVEAFLDIFQSAGCRMVEMTCADHDKHAAGSQFITHMMGRVLEKLGLENTPINTKGYESLLNLVDNTARDSFELFYGLFLYNKNAMEQLDRMDWAFEMVKKQLSGYLHGLVRKQLMLETTGSNSSGDHADVINGNNNDNTDKKLMLPSPSAKVVVPPSELNGTKQPDLVTVNGR